MSTFLICRRILHNILLGMWWRLDWALLYYRREGWEMRTSSQTRNFIGRELLEDLVADGRIILKCIWKMRVCVLDLFVSGCRLLLKQERAHEFQKGCRSSCLNLGTQNVPIKPVLRMVRDGEALHVCDDVTGILKCIVPECRSDKYLACLKHESLVCLGTFN
jgi:hypothetical protein